METKDRPLGGLFLILKNLMLPLILIILLGVFCLAIGSVKISPKDIVLYIADLFRGNPLDSPQAKILFQVRFPRVISSGLAGAALALAGAIMQGVLKNPLADGSTLGVSAAGSLGAAIAIVTGFTLPHIPYSGVVILSIIFSISSLVLNLYLAQRLDKTGSNFTIILLGIIFSMLASSSLSLIMMAFKEDMDKIFTWTMGSFAGSTYPKALILLISLLIFSLVSLFYADDLNAFALGEDQARHLGVDVKKSKKVLLVSSSSLVGVSVAIAGNIAFVGIIIPHLVRLIVGANFRKILPLSIFMGSGFLMLADLVSRTIFSPLEIPIGVISSFVGTLSFIIIFLRRNSYA